MSGISILVPRNDMVKQAENIVNTHEFNITIKEIKKITSADAVKEARAVLSRGTNIIIARGLQASIIKKYTQVPVVEITLTGQELGLLINKAKNIVNKEIPTIGIVGFSNMFSDMRYFNQIYNIDLKTYLTSDTEGLSKVINKAIEDKVDIIIGGDEANIAAAKAEIPSIFLDSTEDSIREAIKVAKKLQETIELEKRNTAQLDTLLDNSFSGIIKINQQCNVIVMNKIMEKLLNEKNKDVVGKPIEEVIRDLPRDNIENVLNGEKEVYLTHLNINDNAVVIIVAPIKVDESIEGAMITCHKVKQIQQLGSEIQQERYLYGYVAKGDFNDILSESKANRQSIELAKLYSQSKSPILITGEVGTEKDLFAQAIHNNSYAKYGPYVSVNCYGINEEKQSKILFGSNEGDNSKEQNTADGAFIAANHGTILISEIDQLSMRNQYSLYKVIRYKSLIRNDIVQTLSSSVRIIATTTKELALLVKEGKFREDLYYLLQGLTIEVKPIRERPEDLETLINKYLNVYNENYSRYHVLTKGAKEVLLNYEWYGNLIQLESFFDRLILTATHRSIDEGFVRNLITELYPNIEIHKDKEQIVLYQDPEANEIINTLKKHNGNRSLVAEELGISTTTLWRRMKKYGINNNYEI